MSIIAETQHSFNLTSLPQLPRQLWCLYCEKSIHGLHCYECQVCGYTAHKKCIKFVKQGCWDLPPNNDMNGNPINPKNGPVSSAKTSSCATFMEALSCGNPKVIASMAQQLCGCNSDEINAQDSAGNTVLHLAAMGEVSLQIFKLVLRSKKINCNIQNRDGNIALHYLCQYCQTPEAAELCDELIAKGSNVNTKNFNGESPLHKAMFNKHVRFILGEKLLRHGADINLQNKSGDTALHYAVRLRREDLVRFLLANGALSVAGKGNKTPSQVAVEENLYDVKRIIDGVQEVHNFLESLNLEQYKLKFVDAELKLPGVMNVLNSGLLDRIGVKDSLHKMTLLQNGPLRKIQISPKAEYVKRHIVETANADLKFLTTDSWIIQHHELEFVHRLGHGAFATVFSGIFMKNLVAIKVMHREITDEKSEFVKEFAIMSKIISENPSPRVIRLFGAVLEPRFSLVMELAGRGSLYQLLKDRKFDLDWPKFFKFCIHACEGMAYLHALDPPILHRDLKPLNLMVTDSMDLKVGDFGMSKYGDDRSYSGIKGTPAYLAPETIKGSNYSYKSDVYSMGIIIWELVYRCLFGEHMEPYENIRSSGLQLLYKVAADGIRPQVPHNCPAEVKRVIEGCLGNEVMLRPDFSVLVERLRGIEKVYNANKEAWDALRQPAPPYSQNSSSLSSSYTPLSPSFSLSMSSMTTTEDHSSNSSCSDSLASPLSPPPDPYFLNQGPPNPYAYPFSLDSGPLDDPSSASNSVTTSVATPRASSVPTAVATPAFNTRANPVASPGTTTRASPIATRRVTPIIIPIRSSTEIPRNPTLENPVKSPNGIFIDTPGGNPIRSPNGIPAETPTRNSPFETSYGTPSRSSTGITIEIIKKAPTTETPIQISTKTEIPIVPSYSEATTDTLISSTGIPNGISAETPTTDIFIRNSTGSHIENLDEIPTSETTTETFLRSSTGIPIEDSVVISKEAPVESPIEPPAPEVATHVETS